MLANHVTRVTDGSAELEALEEIGSVLATRTGYGTTLTFVQAYNIKHTIIYEGCRTPSTNTGRVKPRNTSSMHHH